MDLHVTILGVHDAVEQLSLRLCISLFISPMSDADQTTIYCTFGDLESEEGVGEEDGDRERCDQQNGAISLSAEIGVGNGQTQMVGSLDRAVSQMGSDIRTAFGSTVCTGQVSEGQLPLNHILKCSKMCCG